MPPPRAVLIAHAVDAPWLMLSMTRQSHPEHPKPRLFDLRVVSNRESQPQIRARLGGIDDPVVPQACRGVVGASLRVILGQDRIGDGALLAGRELLPLPRELVALDGRQHAGRLLA